MGDVDRMIEVCQEIQRERDELRAEMERLRTQHRSDPLATAQLRIAKLEAENERLRTFVQKVALFCNDPHLAREANKLVPGAKLDSW